MLKTEDDVRRDTNVAKLWKDHFQSIFDCIPDKEENLCYDAMYSAGIKVSHNEISDAIGKLVNKKACGLDGIYTEHLKYNNTRLHLLFEHVLYCSLVHGTLPETLMSVSIVPVIKDKSDRLGDKNNNRQIALANILSKVIERILLDRISVYLSTASN